MLGSWLFMLAISSAALVAGMSGSARASDKPARSIEAVLELFTSQGCSSCPAADELFESYTEKPNLLALSFPIDIWDKLGWKDTLASPKFSKRQKAYAKMRHDGRIYTPQIVINGGAHVVGSNKNEIDLEVAKAISSGKSMWIPIVAGRDGDVIKIDVDEQSQHAVAEATLWLVNFERRITVDIPRGENAGKTVTYSNVVRELTPIGVWSGTKTELKLPLTAVGDGKSTRGAVILQRGGSGRIIGAAEIAAR